MEAILRGASPRYSRDQGDFDRAIGFIDATFALALTLLVTTIDVDRPRMAFSSFGTLDDAVGQQLVRAIAFAVIATYWLRHHRLIASFAAIDNTAILVNLLLIAAIVLLLPFSTNAVGDPGVEDFPLPTVIMAVNVVAASLLYTLVYVVAVRGNLLSTVPSRGEVSYFVVNALASAVVFTTWFRGWPACISPTAAQITWIGLLPIGWLLARYTARWCQTTRNKTRSAFRGPFPARGSRRQGHPKSLRRERNNVSPTPSSAGAEMGKRH